VPLPDVVVPVPERGDDASRDRAERPVGRALGENRTLEIAYHLMMSAADALGRPGWTPDPADRVTVVPVHDPTCPAATGAACRCRPRLELRLVQRPEASNADDRVVELELGARRVG